MKLQDSYAALLLAEDLNNAHRNSLGLPPAPFNPSSQREYSFYLFAVYETSNPGKLTYDAFLKKMDEEKFAAEFSKFIDKKNALREALSTDKKKVIEK